MFADVVTKATVFTKPPTTAYINLPRLPSADMDGDHPSLPQLKHYVLLFTLSILNDQLITKSLAMMECWSSDKKDTQYQFSVKF